MDRREIALKAHKEWEGKIEVISRAKVTNREELAVAYTPGVAEPCVEIQKDESLAYEYTRKGQIQEMKNKAKKSLNILSKSIQWLFTGLFAICALANGLQPVTLGKRILRTETAGMFVLSAIGFALEK